HVLPLLNGGKNGSVRRRPSNAALFQLLHQRRFVVARRWLGEVLLRLQFAQSERLSGFERGQFVLQFLVFLVLAFLGLFVNSEETIEFQDRTGYAEPERFVAALRVDIYRRLVENRRIDLRSHEALPDQLVYLELI